MLDSIYHMTNTLKSHFWRVLANWIKFTFIRRQLLKNANIGITAEWTAWANRNHGKSWSIVQEDKNAKENILKSTMW